MFERSEELDAWCAGFIETQSFIHTQKGRGPCLRVRSTNHAALVQFADAWDLRVVEEASHFMESPRRNAQKKVWAVHASQARTREILFALRPYAVSTRAEIDTVLSTHLERPCAVCGRELDVRMRKNTLYCSAVCKKKGSPSAPSQ